VADCIYINKVDLQIIFCATFVIAESRLICP
jgi:hypothetical protein